MLDELYNKKNESWERLLETDMDDAKYVVS